MKTVLFFTILFLIIFLNCGKSINDQDENGYQSWASVQSINSITRISRNRVDLECTIALPTPCCTHTATSIEKGKSTWTIELNSTCSNSPCVQVIQIDTTIISLDILPNTTKRLVFKHRDTVDIDTTVVF